MSISIDTSRAPSAESPNAALSMGCIALFLLPFAGLALVTGGSGARRAIQGHWLEGSVLVVLGAMFATVAVAGTVALMTARKKLGEQQALKQARPEEPWRWRSDWAAGRISDSSRSTVWVSWAVTAFWNLISIPTGFAGVRAALQQNNPAGYVALLFPAVGMGFLIWAVRATLRHRKYGASQLELSTIPGAIGRGIAGAVRVSAPLQPTDGFEVILRCVRRITRRSGKNSSTTERILWQEERRSRGETSRDARGFSTHIPIRFALPADAQASDQTNPRDRIIWRLEITASVPGVDYASTFEVPVFRTRDSATPATGDAAGAEELLPLEEYRQPSSSRIVVTTNRRGTEVFFPALRNPGVAAGFIAFTLGWTGVVAALVVLDAPTLFPIVFGLFWLLLVVGTLQQCLGVSRAVANSGSLAYAHGYLSPGGERTIALQEIEDLSIRIGMQAGSRPYYDVVVVRKNGKPVPLGRAVRNKREAEWLAGTLKQALGLTGRRSEVPAGYDG
jgi:hypothetical protein